MGVLVDLNFSLLNIFNMKKKELFLFEALIKKMVLA